MSVMLITHDLGVIAEVADRVVVAYAGKAVEIADVRTIFRAPLHPYTRALYDSIPRLTDTKGRRLDVISGTVPNPLEFPAGCRFHPRCKDAREICRQEEPPLITEPGGRQVRCFRYAPATKHLFQEGSGPWTPSSLYAR